MNPDLPLIVAYGGGTNSTAMLCGFREKGIKPSLIVFSDTGGELPHTYGHIQTMNEKCIEWFGIGIETTKHTHKGKVETLEQQCIRTKLLPSLAYGYKQCSIHFKARPSNKLVKRWASKNGVTSIIKAIGFSYDEPWRIKHKFDLTKDAKLTIHSKYYLVEWQWNRALCVDAISRHGIKQPGKSSCWFCPAHKPALVLKLREERPDLFDRGVKMEENSSLAKDGTEGVRGLCFGTKWSDIANADDAQAKLFNWVGDHASPSVPCGCYDG